MQLWWIKGTYCLTKPLWRRLNPKFLDKTNRYYFKNQKASTKRWQSRTEGLLQRWGRKMYIARCPCCHWKHLVSIWTKENSKVSLRLRYANDIHQWSLQCKRFSQPLHFADDTCLLNIQSKISNINSLNKDLKEHPFWQISLNVAKTEITLLKTKKKPCDTELRLTLCRKILKYATRGKICKYMGYKFSDTYFPVYILGFCPYTGKLGLKKTFIFAYLMQCPTESNGKLRYNILLLRCTCKVLSMKCQTCCTDIFQSISSGSLVVEPYVYSASILNLLNSNQIS